MCALRVGGISMKCHTPAIYSLLAIGCLVTDCRKGSTSDPDSASDTSPSPAASGEPSTPPEAGTLVVGLTESALTSMPTIKTAGEANPIVSVGTLVIDSDTALTANSQGLSLDSGPYVNTPVAGSPVNTTMVQKLFEFECWWGPARANHYNRCPSGIKQELTQNPGSTQMGQAKYNYDLGSIIGNIAGAEEHIAGVYNAFQDPAERTSASTVPAACKSVPCSSICHTTFTSLISNSCVKSDHTLANTSVCTPLGSTFTDNDCESKCEACFSSWSETNQQDVGTPFSDPIAHLASTTGYENAPASGGDPSKFIIPVTGLYDAYEMETDNVNNARISIFHQHGAQDGHYAYVTFRKNAHLNGITMNDIFQVFVEMQSDLKTMHVMGFQVTNIGLEATRNILLINFEKNTFLLKFANLSISNTGEAYTDPETYLVAAGTGGLDFATGLWREGAYFVKAKDRHFDLVWSACVDNKTQTVKSLDIATATECASVKNLFQDNGIFNPADFLDLTETEKTDLAGFLAFFSDSQPLTKGLLPQSLDDVKHLPDMAAPQ